MMDQIKFGKRMWESVDMDLLMHGNAFVHVTRSADGERQGRRLEPTSVMFIDRGDQTPVGIPRCSWCDRQIGREVDRWDVPGTDGEMSFCAECVDRAKIAADEGVFTPDELRELDD